jgi:hypothetical protein
MFDQKQKGLHLYASGLNRLLPVKINYLKKSIQTNPNYIMTLFKIILSKLLIHIC